MTGRPLRESANAVVARAELDARDVLAGARSGRRRRRAARCARTRSGSDSRACVVTVSVRSTRSIDRLVAEPAGRGLRVLLAHGVRDVGRRQAELREPIRLQPDADRIVARAEHLHVAHARNAAQLVDDVQRRVVRDEQLVVAAVRRVERQNHAGSSAAPSGSRRLAACTSSGRSWIALCTRFCTLMSAMSGSVPTANVMAIVSELAVDELPESM